MTTKHKKLPSRQTVNIIHVAGNIGESRGGGGEGGGG